MSATSEPCVYSVNIKVPKPECIGKVEIMAAAEGFIEENGTVKIEANTIVNLNASGCTGNVNWSNGSGTTSQIKLVPSENNSK